MYIIPFVPYTVYIYIPWVMVSLSKSPCRRADLDSRVSSLGVKKKKSRCQVDQPPWFSYGRDDLINLIVEVYIPIK